MLEHVHPSDTSMLESFLSEMTVRDCMGTGELTGAKCLYFSADLEHMNALSNYLSDLNDSASNML